ncbi:MAG: carbonic anhydrase family protein [Methylococcaceae bacterium]
MEFLLQKTVLVLSCVAASVTFAADAPHWTYDEQDIWAEIPSSLKPAWLPPYAECGLGQKQSPVDLGAAKLVTTTNLLQTRYKAEPLVISNNGHTVKMNTKAGNFYIGAEKYDLLQYHIHAPSEHVINGKTYPVEIHFVHGTPDGKLAVLGVFAEEGAVNVEFQKILAHAPTKVEDATINGVNINPSNLLPLDKKSFFLYSGSLTTPPCTEGVNWYVLKNPIQLSKEQINTIKTFYSGNARQDQPLNGRQVLNK